MTKPDLDSKERIAQFVDAFYANMLQDELLGPVFVEVAEVDLSIHLPLIKSYWQKLLLGDSSYRRHTMNIHRALNTKRTLRSQDFERWLTLFTTSVDQQFSGPYAERAKRLANNIAANMMRAIINPP